MYGHDFQRRPPWLSLLVVASTIVLGLLTGLAFKGGLNPFAPSQAESGGGTAPAANHQPTSIPGDGAATPPALATATTDTTRRSATATMPTLSAVTAGASAPDFTLTDLFDEEKSYTLAAYGGRPVVLNFWASWCVPCRREMPALEATAARYEREGLLLLGMNQTYLDDIEAARAFVQELNLTFPQTRDNDGVVGSDTYRVVGIPTTVFIRPDGVVAHIQIGEMSLEQITLYTERLMAGEALQP